MEHMAIVSAPTIPEVIDRPMHLVLPHLYDRPEYFEPYRDAKKLMLQDNSIFELGQTLEGGATLWEVGVSIGAQEIMVPEKLRDARACIDLTMKFFEWLPDDDWGTKKQYAAAIQGKNYEELKMHYAWLSQHPRIHTIAIPFNFEFDAFDHVDEQAKHDGWNRFSLIARLVAENLWNYNKEHHLLGLYNPAELAQYSRMGDFLVGYGLIYRHSSFLDSIRSNDSSSAFWHAIYGAQMDRMQGLSYRKIETEVDFTLPLQYTRQKRAFAFNLAIIDDFCSGKGGDVIWKKYSGEYRERWNAQD